MKEWVFYYYEPDLIIKHYFLTHTEREKLFLKLKKTYIIEPITNIKRYFISQKEIVKLFIQILKSENSVINHFY